LVFLAREEGEVFGAWKKSGGVGRPSGKKEGEKLKTRNISGWRPQPK